MLKPLYHVIFCTRPIVGIYVRFPMALINIVKLPADGGRAPDYVDPTMLISRLHDTHTKVHTEQF